METYSYIVDKLAIYLSEKLDSSFFLSFQGIHKKRKVNSFISIYNLELGYNSKEIEFSFNKRLNKSLQEYNTILSKSNIELNIITKSFTNDGNYNECRRMFVSQHTNILNGGGGLAIKNGGAYKRTLGLFFEDSVTGVQYGLTCRHGLTKGSKLVYSRYNDYNRYNLGEIIYQPDINVFNRLDYSLIKLDQQNSYTSNLIKIGKIDFKRNLCLSKNEPVYKYGNQTAHTNGFLKSKYCAVYTKERGLNLGLIQIHQNNCSFSERGDSGSAAINQKREIIGLISFERQNYIYLVPFDKIVQDIENLENLNINFKLI